VCASGYPAGCYFVPFGKLIFNGKLEVGKSGTIPGDKLFIPLGTSNSGLGRIVEDEIGGI